MALTFANREVCNLIFCDFATQKPIHNLDYANATSQELTGEQVYAYGGQGHPKRVTFYGEKGGTLTVETQLMSSELFAICTGAEIETAAKFLKRMELKADNGSITVPGNTTLSEAPGALTVYKADDDMGTPLEASISGKTITLSGDASTHTGDCIVYAMENLETGVKKMSIKATTFPKAVTIYGETLMKGEDGVDYPYKMIAYKASPQQTFSFGFSNSGDPVTLTLNFDLLADKDDNIMDMILIEEQT